MEDVFGIDNFNVISDNEYYYFFRALEDGDIKDIENGIIIDNDRIRTDRERWEEEKGKKAKYSENSEITLEEVFDHIKMHYLSKTNCISLSSNSNVAMTYGQVNKKYAIVKVSKKDMQNVYNAGQYMLEQVKKEIDKVISELPKDSDILNIIDSINKTNEHKQIQDNMKNVFKKAKTGGEYTGKKREVDKKISVTDRLSKKQYFSDEQQAEYDKIIAKLTILETYGKLKNIIPNAKDNAFLIQTIGGAFSSAELIHYKDVPKEKITMISKNLMDMLALLQQAKDNDRDNKQIKEIEERILDLANNGHDLIEKNGRLIFSNGSQEIDIKEANNDVLLKEDDYNISNELNIENVYKITNGTMNYEKVKKAIESAFYLSKSKVKTYEIVDVLRSLTGNKEEYKEIFNKIENEGFTIDSNIIKRQNNKGKKLCESVNLDMNEEGKASLTYKEQEKLINIIENLNKEGMHEIIKSGGMNVHKEIFDNILEETEEKTENRYFAEAIIDTVEMPKNDNKSYKLKKEDRERIIQRIEEGNAKGLYQAIEKTGVEKEKIPAIFLNIVSMNALKGFEYSELSQDLYLDEIIKKDKDNFRDKIGVTDLDILKGKKIDDSYIIPGTNIKLRDYQNKAFKEINKIYETQRYASVVLPTGAGKSFVAMAQMLETRKNNKGNIIYFAPNTTILHQLKNHIIKNILKDDYENYKTEKQKDEAIKNGLKQIGLDINLKLKCYQSLTQKDKEELAKFNADFIILDEVHRTGAEKWFEQIEELINQNKDAKVLGITATPERDADEKNMTEELARITGYSEEDIQKEKYMAYKMELIEAMQDEIVVTPNVVTTLLKPTLNDKNEFKYELESKEQLSQIKEALDLEQDETKKEELQKVYNDMQNIVKNVKGIPELLNEYMKKKDGKYIIFIPSISKDENEEKLTDEKAIEHFKNYQKLVKNWFDEAGIKLNEDEMYYMSSHRKPNKENDEALQKFESSKSDSAKLMFVYGKLDEGVHVDGINGIMWLRSIDENSRIKYMQQLGRCIYGLNPNEPIKEEDIPVVFDFMNNTLRQNMDKKVNTHTNKSDLEKLTEIVEWINEHDGIMPDINCGNKIEERRAINLKRIQEKYSKYLANVEIDDKEIRAILELGKEIELWNIELEDKLDKEGKVIPVEKLSKINNFEVIGEMKNYLNLINEGLKIREHINKDNEIGVIKGRKDKLIEVLTEINNIVNLEFKSLKEVETIEEIIYKYSDPKHRCDYKERKYVKAMDEETKENLLKHGKKYNVFREINFFKKNINEYDTIDIERKTKLIQLGLIKTETDERGYSKYSGINRRTLSKYNERGWSKEGIHKDTQTEYNPEHWSRDNINEFTKTKYDSDHWSKNGINEFTGTKYDPDGYDYEGWDKRGFNKKGINRYTGQKYDPDGYDKNGLDKDGLDKKGYDKYGIKEGWTKDGINRKTGFKWDENMKLINGKYIPEFKKIERYIIEGTYWSSGFNSYEVNYSFEVGVMKEKYPGAVEYCRVNTYPFVPEKAKLKEQIKRDYMEILKNIKQEKSLYNKMKDSGQYDKYVLQEKAKEINQMIYIAKRINLKDNLKQRITLEEDTNKKQQLKKELLQILNEEKEKEQEKNENAKQKNNKTRQLCQEYDKLEENKEGKKISG